MEENKIDNVLGEIKEYTPGFWPEYDNMNWFQRRIYYIKHWFSIKFWEIKFSFQKREAERETKIYNDLTSKLIDKKFKQLRDTIQIEVVAQMKSNRFIGLPTYIGFEGIKFEKFQKSFEKFSVEYKWAMLNPITRFIYKKMNKIIEPDKFSIYPAVPIYFATRGMISDQRIIICTKGTNLILNLSEPGVLNLKLSEQKQPDTITEIYINNDFTIKEIIKKWNQ